MNQKRKAELQRKLSMTSVPRPPAGLADRIKADIPYDLRSTERERDRFSRSTRFSLGVAASILVLISSVYISVRLLSRSENARFVSMPAQAPATVSKVAQAPAAAPPAEVTINVAEKKKDADSFRDEVRRAQPARQYAPQVVAEGRRKIEQAEAQNEPVAKHAERSVEGGAERGVVGGVVGGTLAAAPPPPAAAAAAPAPAPASPAESVTITAAAPAVLGRATPDASSDIVKSARAADLALEPPRALFGISVDPTAFDRVKQHIDQGERPTAGSVDVAALVNYFAGSGRPPRHDLRLDVEASRAPLAPDNTALLRFTIDTPSEAVPPGSSSPPVATRAELEIWLNSQAVAMHRLIGAEELKMQATLLKNTSVTGLVDLKLKPGVWQRTVIATLTLRYRSVADGKRHTITKDVRASDVSRTWSSASRRHRLATLGAVWGESLTAGAPGGDVAGTAEKLATEAPDDARARELAAAASASSRLQSSGPTGSGR